MSRWQVGACPPQGLVRSATCGGGKKWRAVGQCSWCYEVIGVAMVVASHQSETRPVSSGSSIFSTAATSGSALIVSGRTTVQATINSAVVVVLPALRATIDGRIAEALQAAQSGATQPASLARVSAPPPGSQGQLGGSGSGGGRTSGRSSPGGQWAG